MMGPLEAIHWRQSTYGAWMKGLGWGWTGCVGPWKKEEASESCRALVTWERQQWSLSRKMHRERAAGKPRMGRQPGLRALILREPRLSTKEYKGGLLLSGLSSNYEYKAERCGHLEAIQT